MTLSQITITLILGILDGARRVLGDDAIKTANSIEGLKVTPNGEIVVTGDGMKILKKLLKACEADLHGEVILDLDVRVNVARVGDTESEG